MGKWLEGWKVEAINGYGWDVRGCLRKRVAEKVWRALSGEGGGGVEVLGDRRIEGWRVMET